MHNSAPQYLSVCALFVSSGTITHLSTPLATLHWLPVQERIAYKTTSYLTHECMHLTLLHNTSLPVLSISAGTITHLSTPLATLHWLPVQERIAYKTTSSLTHECMHNSALQLYLSLPVFTAKCPVKNLDSFGA